MHSAVIHDNVPTEPHHSHSVGQTSHGLVDEWWDTNILVRLRNRLGLGDEPKPLNDATVDGSTVTLGQNDVSSDRFVTSVPELHAWDKECDRNAIFYVYNPSQSDALIQAAKLLTRSVVICMPMRNSWIVFTKNCVLLSQFSKRSLLLTRAVSSDIPRRVPANMNVWYKPTTAPAEPVMHENCGHSCVYDPVQVIAAATCLFSMVPAPATKHKMQFAGTISGIPATILADTGAECKEPVPYISAHFCQLHQIPVDCGSRPGEVQGLLGDGTETVKGTARVRMQIGSYTEYVKCIVINMQNVFDVVLSDAWLNKMNAVLDYGPMSTLTIRPMHRKYVLTPVVLGNRRVQQRNLQEQPQLLSFVSAKRNLRKGAEATLLLITERADPALHDTDTHSGNPSLLPQAAVDKLVADYPTVFTTELPFGGSRIQLDEVIPTPPGARPVNRPIFHYSPLEMEEIERQISELLDLGYIRPSSSPWGAPVLLVKKPRSTALRMVIDYRALNALTTSNASPLPPIDSLLQMIAGAKVFSTLDLSKAYNQCKLIDSDIPKTAFKTPFGHYEFKPLSFGLKNAPSIFQMAMNHLF